MLTVHTTVSMNVAMSVILNNSDFDNSEISEDSQNIAESVYLSTRIGVGEEGRETQVCVLLAFWY
jgi:hypothetical protein